jgi:2OG-Fe(II) oxygenase superfamily
MSSSWDVVQVGELSEDVLDALFDNEIAAVRIPNFVSPEACRATSAAVAVNGFDYYDTLEPPLGRIGVTCYDHRHDQPGYFRLAADARDSRERLFETAGDPIPLMMDAVSAAWPGKVALASEDAYGDYFAGVVRITVGGIRVHCDWAQHDQPGWQVANVTGQLAWNIYYDLTEEGGETTVYRRASAPDIESYAQGAFGFYDPDAVEPYERRVIDPRKGELVIFSSRNAHAVNPTSGEGVRISAASFIGRLPDRSIIFWS